MKRHTSSIRQHTFPQSPFNNMKPTILIPLITFFTATITFASPPLQLSKEAFPIPGLKGVDDLLFIEHGVIGTGKPQGNHFCDYVYGHNAVKGGGLYILKNFQSSAPVRINVLDGVRVPSGKRQGMLMSKGAVYGPDLSFDAKRIVFAWTTGEGKDDRWAPDHAWDIFEIGVDGTGIKRLTNTGHDDFDPCYLPNGRIVFVSTRRGGFGRCHPVPKPTATLYSMKGDGSDVICLSYHETNEFQPSVTNDGKIVYTRWDYVDRQAEIAHHMWECNPDGTDPRAYHGNYPKQLNRRAGTAWKMNVDRPMSEFHIRAIPGSNKNGYVATAGPHHGQHYGSLIMIDLSIPDDGMGSQITKLTPQVGYPEVDVDNKIWTYGTIWPVSEKHFIVNRERSLVLLDRQGNEQLIYTTRGNKRLRPNEAIPVAPRPVPPIIPTTTYQGERASAEAPNATISVINVYDMAKMHGVIPKGTIKQMRIVQVFPKTTPVMDKPKIGWWNMMNVRMPLGAVPVEKDGSVYCEAPVGKAIYFQLLDENGAAVQIMRSVTYVHPGEQLYCAGCHENKYQAAQAVYTTPLAMRRPPSRLKPELDTEHIWPFTFYRAVKPIVDSKCVTCHKAKGFGPDVPDMSLGSIRPYLASGPRLPFIPHISTIDRKYGALKARLYTEGFLSTEHHGVKLTDQEVRRVLMWLDLFCQQRSSYANTPTRLEAKEAQWRGERMWPTMDIDTSSEETILGVERHKESISAESSRHTMGKKANEGGLQ